MDRGPATERSPATQRKCNWPWRLIIPIFVVIVIVQNLFLPCLCAAGNVKIGIATGVDLLVGARMLLARIRGEEGRDWIFYLALAASTLISLPLLID